MDGLRQKQVDQVLRDFSAENVHRRGGGWAYEKSSVTVCGPACRSTNLVQINAYVYWSYVTSAFSPFCY